MSRSTRFSTILAAATLLAAAAVLAIMVGSDRGAPGGDVAYAQATCGSAVADRSNTGLVSDCNALLAARNILRGTASLDWTPNTHISEGGMASPWEGSPQRVTKIKLQKRGLTGGIPSEIGRLDALQELWLYNNDLSGAIPPEMGKLADLRGLFVSSNKLRGQIPEALNRLALDRLWLYMTTTSRAACPTTSPWRGSTGWTVGFPRARRPASRSRRTETGTTRYT